MERALKRLRLSPLRIILILIGLFIVGCYVKVELDFRCLREGARLAASRVAAIDLRRLREDCRALCDRWADLPSDPEMPAHEKVLDLSVQGNDELLPDSLREMHPAWVLVATNHVQIRAWPAPRVHLLVVFDELPPEHTEGMREISEGVWLCD